MTDSKNTLVTSADISGAVPPPCLLSLAPEIRGHADLSFCAVGENKFVTAKNAFEYYKEKLGEVELICGATEVKSPYPLDAAYCAAVFGRFAVANEKITDSVLLSYLKSEYTFINVGQGYAKCNICPVKDAVITEDEGIYRALLPYTDVLLIKKGFVSLSGYDYGFFGGATGMISEDELFINGDLKNHPDADKIYAFLEKYNVKTIERSGQIRDVGSVIPLNRKGR